MPPCPTPHPLPILNSPHLLLVISSSTYQYTSCSDWPISDRFQPGAIRAGDRAGASLLRFWRSCEVCHSSNSFDVLWTWWVFKDKKFFLKSQKKKWVVTQVPNDGVHGGRRISEWDLNSGPGSLPLRCVSTVLCKLSTLQRGKRPPETWCTQCKTPNSAVSLCLINVQKSSMRAEAPRTRRHSAFASRHLNRDIFFSFFCRDSPPLAGTCLQFDGTFSQTCPWWLTKTQG